MTLACSISGPMDAASYPKKNAAMQKMALLSVSDKTGLVDFAKALAAAGYSLLSTGGTAQLLKEAHIEVVEVAEWTGAPELLDGRLKTLHPKVHGSILWKRDDAKHAEQVTEQDFGSIDLTVINLYPFEKTIASPGCTREQAIEMIDIGGPAMIRSAAKNHAHVTVVVDSGDYGRVADALNKNGEVPAALRRELATKAFEITSRYDAAIANYLNKNTNVPTPTVPSSDSLPEHLTLNLHRIQPLRYGENPHQQAARYQILSPDNREPFVQLHGKELSYNNWLDIAAAAGLIQEFTDQPPTVGIFKHTNPCGVGTSATLLEAWERAFATDQQAPFGGIIAVNYPLDLATATAIGEIFSEVIIAPEFHPDALDRLRLKKNLRLVQNKSAASRTVQNEFQARSIGFDQILVQNSDPLITSNARIDWKVVTKRAPTEQEWHDLMFAWRIAKHVKSNAIVYARDSRTLGIGAGQMSRIDASRLAVWKAQNAALSLKKSVVASDAFFPFSDGLLAAAEAGAIAVIQPGGSVRDSEVIEAADAKGMAMVFTGRRHFRH